MGGTFDPIHYGHLVIAEAVRSKYKMEKVVFVPSGSPPHKNGSNVSDAMDRYLMTALATATNKHFDISTMEIDRSGKSYTYDTLVEFKKKYPRHDIYFIAGADAIRDITTWYNYEELFELCYFIAATRPGYTLANLKNEELHMLSPKQLEHIEIIEVPGIEVSSTDIKRRVREDKSIKYLLPETVEDYITKYDLYLDSEDE